MERPKLKIFLLVALCLSIVGVEFFYSGFGALAHNVAGFGTEYGNTAASLVRGGGFSNPFGFQSGPSSWVPPVIVALYALVFTIFGVKTYAAGLALLTLRAIVLTAAVWSLVEAAQILEPRSSSSLVVIPLSAVGLFGHYHWLSQRCTDQWIIILASGLAVLCLLQIQAQKVRPWHYAFSFLLPITAPAVGLGFGLILLWRSLIKPGLILPLVLAFALSTGAWTARNMMVMKAPFLIKSNVGFEFYLSNQCSPSGLLTTAAHQAHHPLYPRNTTSQEIREVGESEFCQGYRVSAFQYIQNEPREFVRKMAARAVNAFLFSRFYDLRTWTRRIRGLGYALFPALLLILGLLRGGWRHPQFQNTLILYLGFFLPYILISHGERYQLGALGFQIWIVWLTLGSSLFFPGPQEKP